MTSSFFSTLPRIVKKVKRQWKYELIPSTLRCYLDVQNEELVLLSSGLWSFNNEQTLVVEGI